MRSVFISIGFILILSGITDAQDPGFFLNDWQGKTAVIPDHESMDKPVNEATINIKVDTGQVLNKVPTYIYGNNAVTWDNGLPENATAMEDLKNLNPQVLRWPGGNLSNNFFWNLSSDQPPDDIPADIDPWYGQNTADWQMSVDEYYDLLEETNSTGIICVNYSYARYGTGPDPVAKAAHMAAEWVRYDNGRSKFWEIGNENYGNWQAGYKIDVSKNQDGQPEYISGQLYGQHCRVFIDSMRKAAADVGVDIKIGVVAYDAETSYDPISQVWNEGMMPEVGDVADFLVVHSYFTPYNQNSGVSTILNSHDVPEEIMSAIVSDMNEAGKPMIPVAMTEWNIFAEGSMQQVSYINGMLAALSLGEFVRNDYGLATRWDLVNGWNNGNDHGMFSVGGEPGVDSYNPRPVFFYMYYFQKYFGDRMVQLTQSGSNQVISYASTFSSGETGLVIINKSTINETALIDFEHFEPGVRYYYHILTGGDDNGSFSRKVRINGIETDEQGGGPDNYECINARSSRTRDGISVDLPPLSVVYLLVDKKPPLSYVSSKVDTNARVVSLELSEQVMPFDNPVGFEVKANDTLLNISNIEQDQENPYNVIIFLHEEVTNDDLVTLTYSGNDIVSTDGTPLKSFSDTVIQNLLPVDPVEIQFVIRYSKSNEPVDNSEVQFNNKTSYTDESGHVSFMAQAGQYMLNVHKRHLESVVNRKLEILSDTMIAILMDSAKYKVTLMVRDAETGQKLSIVEISVHSQTLASNFSGEVDTELQAGSHLFVFQRQNYHGLDARYTIASDTTLMVSLERSAANVKFRLKTGSKPLNEGMVILGRDTLFTNALGLCTFEAVPIDAVINYSFDKQLFVSDHGSIEIQSDTTIDLQIEKSVANIEFQVSMNNGFLSNAFTVIEPDTVWLNDGGFGKFYNLSKNKGYVFSIQSDNSSQYMDSLVLTNDTTLRIQLVATKAHHVHTDEGIIVYPNPADKVLHVKMKADVHQLEIVNAMGKTIFKKGIDPVKRHQVVDISNSAEGIYFIRCIPIDKKEAWPVKKFVIER